VATTNTRKPPQILSEEHEADPYESYRIWRDHYPVHLDESTNLWVVSRMEDLRTLFKHPGIDSANYAVQIGQFHGRTLIEMEGKEHTAHRRLLSPFLHSSGLEEFMPRIRGAAIGILTPIVQRESARVSKRLIENAVESNDGDGAYEIELVSEFTSVYPITVTREMLGVPDEMQETVVRWYENIADAISDMTADPEIHARAMQTREELRAYFLPIIAERRAGDGQDLISLVAQAEIGDLQLTDDEICAFLSLVIVAGGETTDSAIANMFRLLIQHPDQLQAVYENRRLILDAFAEQLRIAPPVHVTLRHAAEDVEIAGVTIPADSMIGMCLASGNHDETVFEDPDKFDIFRKDNDTDRAFRASADHIAFADGRHFCVGNSLAREEVEIAANVILDAMDGPPWLTPGHEAKEVGHWFRAPADLHLSFNPA
jgi:pulcherriminic acid synthase